jgi:hypothetical protein
MQDRSNEFINQTTRTRRISYALILLALAMPSLFAWHDNVALDSAVEFTALLVAVTLLAFIALRWITHRYSAGVYVQVLLAFALGLAGWSGYASRIAHDERLATVAAPGSDMPLRIPGQESR